MITTTATSASMLNILKRDFSDHQIIIASIYDGIQIKINFVLVTYYKSKIIVSGKIKYTDFRHVTGKYFSINFGI